MGEVRYAILLGMGYDPAVVHAAVAAAAPPSAAAVQAALRLVTGLGAVQVPNDCERPSAAIRSYFDSTPSRFVWFSSEV